MIDLIAVILSMLVGLVQWHNDPDKKRKRDDYEENKALAEGDSRKLSVRLSDRFDRVRRKNSNSKK